MTAFRLSRLVTVALVASAVQFGGLGFAFAADSILNVSYDPTRELYKDYDAAFASYWKAETGQARDGPAW